MNLRYVILICIGFFNQTIYAQENGKELANAENNTANSFFFDGIREKLNENYSSAALNFSKTLNIDPNNDAAWFELAKANFKMDKINEAESNIKKAIELKENKWYWLFLVQVYGRNNNINGLEHVFTQLIRLDPSNSIHYFNKANVLVLTLKTETAENLYNEIEKKFGPSTELSRARLRITKSPQSSQTDVMKFLGNEKTSVKDYLFAAGLYLQRKNINQAIEVLKKANQAYPKNYEINLSLADIYKNQNLERESFEALNVAFESAEMPIDEKVKILVSLISRENEESINIRILNLGAILAKTNSGDAKAHTINGDIFYQFNKYTEALNSYKNALEINDQIYLVWEQVINIHLLLNQFTQALEVGEEALSLYPNQAKLYYFVAFSEFRLKKFNEALKNINQALDLENEDVGLVGEMHALKAEVLLNQNNFQAAKRSFDQAIAIDADNFLIMNNYAYYLALRDEDLEKAEVLANKAANAMVNSASVLDTYAFVLFKQNKFTDAKIWIEKALKLNSNKSAVYLERYGDILFMLGEKEKAIKEWEKALSIDSTVEKLKKKINEKKYIK